MWRVPRLSSSVVNQWTPSAAIADSSQSDRSIAISRVKTMQMFGGIAASVNGNMFGGLFGLSAIVRLYGADHAAALALEGASRFDPMGNGRVSKDTVMLPEDVFHDEEQLRAWLQRALDGAAKLPPKAKKGKAAREAPRAAKKTTRAARTATKKVAKKPRR